MDLDEITQEILDCYGIEEWHIIVRKRPFDLIKNILLTYKGLEDLKAKNHPKKDEKYYKKIVLEIGHGDHPDGFEPGAVDPITGNREWDLNKICARYCSENLEKLGYENVFVTDSGTYLGTIGKDHSDCDIFISIHHNSFSDPRAQGAETLIHNSHWDPRDEELAKVLSKSMSEALNINNRGIKTMSLSILKGAIMGVVKPGKAVVLVEPYFISGKDVENHALWSQKAGKSIADGIHEFLS